MRSNQTRFKTAPAWLARLLLLILILLAGYGMKSQFDSLATRSQNQTKHVTDADLYHAIIARMRGGENYYSATSAELGSRGYPTKPFFTWRLPTLALLLSAAGSDGVAKAIFIGLAVLVLIAWFFALRREGFSTVYALLGVIAMGSALILTNSDNALVYHEFWAGLYIALSLALWRLGWWLPAVAVGTLALVFRELALPFSLLMLGLAWYEGRRKEAIGWGVGIGLGMLLLAWHASAVTPLMQDSGQSKSWLALGGWDFVLTTAQWNMLIILAPAAVVPVIVPLALLGLAGWNSGLGLRVALTLGAFLGAFAIVGWPTNIYWGLIYAPLLPLGWLVCLPALRDLWRAAIPQAAKPVHSTISR